MAKTGYRTWGKGDRHQADYTLRQVRKALFVATEPAEIERLRAAEARAIEDVERVESKRERAA